MVNLRNIKVLNLANNPIVDAVRLNEMDLKTLYLGEKAYNKYPEVKNARLMMNKADFYQSYTSIAF